MTILRHTHWLVRCPDPSEEDETEGMTPEEVHLSFINYWNYRAYLVRSDRLAGYLDALLPRLIAATGLPAQELVRQSAARWIAANRR